MKKKIIIFFIVTLVIVLGVLFVLYKFTDVFKQNKELFWKYALTGADSTEMFNNENITSINNQKVNNSYKQKSEFQLKNENDIYKLTIDTNAHDKNDSFSNIELAKNTDNIGKLKVVKKNNLLSFKLEEMTTFYITLKNSKLTELARKMDVEDADKIPDNLNAVDIQEVLNISEDDVSYLSKKYSNIIVDKTNKNNYSKEDKGKVKIDDKFYEVEKYKLSLSEKEHNEILKEVYFQLAQDSRALNLISQKLKLLNIPEQYSSINSLSSKFYELSKEYANANASDNEYMQITIYVENKKMIFTEIKVKDDATIKVDYSKENNNLKVTCEGENPIQIKNAPQWLNDFIRKIKEINISTNASTEHSEIITKVSCINNDDTEFNYSTSIKITDDIENNNDYENSSNIVLSDYNDTQFKAIYQLLSSKFKEYYDEKINIIQNNIEQDNQAQSEED